MQAVAAQSSTEAEYVAAAEAAEQAIWIRHFLDVHVVHAKTKTHSGSVACHSENNQ